MPEFCKIKNCRQRAESIYYGRGVCGQHGSDHCDNEKRFDLKKRFAIGEKNHG